MVTDYKCIYRVPEGARLTLLFIASGSPQARYNDFTFVLLCSSIPQVYRLLSTLSSAENGLYILKGQSVKSLQLYILQKVVTRFSLTTL